MKLIDLTCNKCGATLKVNSDLKKCMCQYCGNEMLIDDETIHHQIDNAYQAGYQAELGRIKAREDYERKKAERQRYEERKAAESIRIAEQKRILEQKRIQEQQRLQEQQRIQEQQKFLDNYYKSHTPLKNFLEWLKSGLIIGIIIAIAIIITGLRMMLS